MRKIRLVLSLFVCILFLNDNPVYAKQDVLPDVEKVSLFTDRTIYITGEEICFSSVISQEGYPQPLSLVLYVQLISANGSSFSSGKFPITDFKSSGSLSIPEELITGIYYIRAYTKYMRNVGPVSYSVIALKIINPKRNEVLPGYDTLYLENQSEPNDIGDKFSIYLNNENIKPGEQVSATIKFDLPAKDSIKALSVSVAPAEASAVAKTALPASVRRFYNLMYVPEIHGITVSGLVMNDDKPVPGVQVNLSLIEKYNDFQSQLTDSTGRFLFALPNLTDVADLYIGLKDNKSNLPYSLLVDNEYCTLPVKLPQYEFQLSENEKRRALSMAVNSEITKIYYPQTKEEITKTSTHGIIHPFYGKLVYVLFLKDYVQLPTLEEYFNELPGYVKVRKKAGKKYFKIDGDQPEMEYYDPLILVDGVYIADPEKILAASPVNIDRIEMINVPYLKGDMIFGGVLSIITKKGDLAGIDLPSSGFFVSYHFFDSDTCSRINLTPETLPDSRNTIFFSPDLFLSSDNISTFTFKTADTPGLYTITLNGVTKHGTVFRKHLNFNVLIK